MYFWSLSYVLLQNLFYYTNYWYVIITGWDSIGQIIEFFYSAKVKEYFKR
jgi:hypothetical protein